MEKKKQGFSLRRLIYNDKYLIIFSLVIAIFVWIFASINIGTDETKIIKVDAPIVLGDEVSDQLGMQYYSLQDSISLSVSITGPKYVIGQVTADDLDINFDTSSVRRTGEQTIPILVTNTSRTLDFDVTNTYPSTIDAFFDVNEVKTFNVDVDYDSNNVADGYVFGNPVLSDDKVVVSGPQTYVDKVEGIYVDVNFGDDAGLTEPYKADCDLQVKGLGIESNYLTIKSTKPDVEDKLSTVSINLPVLKQVTLPVAIELENRPFDTSDSISITYSTDKILAGVLDSANISQAVIGKVNFNQLSVGNNEFSFDISNLQGITVLDGTKKIDVTVKVSNNYTTKTIAISKNNIVVTGAEAGAKATVSSIDDQTVTVICPSGTSISANDLDIKCDVSNANEDDVYPLTITLNSNNNSWVYGKYNAKVQITK